MKAVYEKYIARGIPKYSPKSSKLAIVNNQIYLNIRFDCTPDEYLLFNIKQPQAINIEKSRSGKYKR